MNKELIRIIEQSSTEDLNEAARVIVKTLDERRDKARKDAWNKVVDTTKSSGIIFDSINQFIPCCFFRAETSMLKLISNG